MKKSLGLQLIAYAFLLGCLSVLAHELAPGTARITVGTGLAGGLLCVAWGVRALTGAPGKALAILTLIPTAFVMLSQSVLAWGRLDGTSSRVAFAVIATVLFLLSVGMLMRIVYAGVALESRGPGPVPGGRASRAQTIPH